MINTTEFLLGKAFTLLTVCREHMIKVQDVDGVDLIEDQYQKLNESINLLENKPFTYREIKDGK